MTPRPGIPLVALLVALASFATGSCADDSAPGTGPSLHLLRRGPDQLLGDGERIAVDPAAGTLRLGEGTGVSYLVAADGGHGLGVSVRAAWPGVLELSVAGEEPWTVELGGGETLDRVVPLARRGDGYLVVSLRWEPLDGPSVLEVRRLDILGAALPPRPPVVLISIDSLAARNMSLYGYSRRTTPRLEELARESVVFEHCVANAPWTLPSFLSLMSGQYPDAHLLTTRTGHAPWETRNLTASCLTLAEAFRAAGYRTAGYVDHYFLTQPYRLAQGFDTYDDEAARIFKTDHDGGLRHGTSRALDWIDSDPASPWFLFLHGFDVHAPYSATDRYEGLFRSEVEPGGPEVPTGGLGNAYGIVPNYVTAAMYGETPPSVPAAEIVAAYDESVAFVDAEIGAFLDALHARGLYDDALIVVTADHGDTMAEGEFLFGHGVFADSVLRVPLLIKLPGGREGGRRVEDGVQLVDLYPTLFDLTGIRGPRTALHGSSLVPAIEGAPSDPRPLLTEAAFMEGAAVHYGGWKLAYEIPGTATLDESVLSHPAIPDEWKRKHVPEIVELGATQEALDRIRARMGEEGYRAFMVEVRRMAKRAVFGLYYLPDDPDATRDLSGEEPERLAQLTGLLLAERERSRSARGSESPATPGAAETTEPAWLSPEVLAELERLGYVGND